MSSPTIVPTHIELVMCEVFVWCSENVVTRVLFKIIFVLLVIIKNIIESRLKTLCCVWSEAFYGDDRNTL